MPLENVPDAVGWTDEGEIGAPLTSILIETEPDAVAWTDTPQTSFITSPFAAGRTLIVAEFKFATSLFVAGKGIRHPTRFYKGIVKSFGSVIRSIQVPAGLPQISDAVVDVVDTSGELRALFNATPPNNRQVVLKIGDDGESESVFQTIYTGIVSHASFPPGLVRINLKDLTFQFLSEQLPNLLTRENFVADPLFAKNLRARTEGAFSEKEIFSPIIFGDVNSVGLDTLGAMNTVRLDSTTFNLAQHPIPHASIRLFEKLPTDQAFVEITGGFSIVEVQKTIEGVDYTFTHAVFGSAKPDQYELRFDSEGMTDDGTKDGAVVRDPAECIRLWMTRIAQRDPIDDIDGIGFSEAGSAMAAVDTGGVLVGLFCDGAITQRMTHQEALARILRSFGIFMFTDKGGKITIRFINQSDPDRPILTDLQDIYRKSETHALARPVFNEVLAQYSRTFSDQNWNANLVVTDDDAVIALAKTERVDHKLFFVRDDNVADSVARSFLQFVNPKSFRIVMTTPGHRRIQDIELGKLVGVTNYSGIGSGGYVNKEFLIYRTEFRTDTKQLKVHAVARAPSPGRKRSQSSEWVTLTSGVGSGTEGDYEELIPSTTDLGTWVLVQITGAAAFNEALFEEFDLAIGEIGSEVNFVDDMLYAWQSVGAGGCVQQDFSFPFKIPAGSRLSARSKDTNVNAITSSILIHVHG